MAKRRDGRLLKTIRPFTLLIPYIMTKRGEAQVFARQEIITDPIDAYLRQKREENVKLSYLHLFIALYVRVIAKRPRLNRFIINNRLYARKGIHISLAVKPSLHDEAEETTVKFSFTGKESLFEIVDQINETLGNLHDMAAQESDLDLVINKIMRMPGPFRKLLVEFLKFLDRHNLMPADIVDASPFHASLFFSYLKSIKTDYVYHHLYDFGTTGLFVALGSVREKAVAVDGQVMVKKCCTVGYTVDERICDGLYLSNSFKLVKQYLEEPHLLEEGLAEIVEDID